jgi:hypothetical protein
MSINTTATSHLADPTHPLVLAHEAAHAECELQLEQDRVRQAALSSRASWNKTIARNIADIQNNAGVLAGASW